MSNSKTITHTFQLKMHLQFNCNRMSDQHLQLFWGFSRNRKIDSLPHIIKALLLNVSAQKVLHRAYPITAAVPATSLINWCTPKTVLVHCFFHMASTTFCHFRLHPRTSLQQTFSLDSSERGSTPFSWLLFPPPGDLKTKQKPTK